MKEIKLTIDGKEIPLKPEQIKALGIDIDDGCVCDRVEYGEYYYSIGYYGTVDEIMELDGRFDCGAYKCGNYYRDKSYAKQVALHQKLNNLLRRYSEQHGGDAEWGNGKFHYFVCIDQDNGTFIVDCNTHYKSSANVYFSSRDVAAKAIEEVVKPFMKEHPDFVW